MALRFRDSLQWHWRVTPNLIPPCLPVYQQEISCYSSLWLVNPICLSLFHLQTFRVFHVNAMKVKVFPIQTEGQKISQVLFIINADTGIPNKDQLLLSASGIRIDPESPAAQFCSPLVICSSFSHLWTYLLCLLLVHNLYPSLGNMCPVIWSLCHCRSKRMRFTFCMTCGTIPRTSLPRTTPCPLWT